MRLFLYGTLLQGGCNPVAIALHRHLATGVPARAWGRLFALPDPAGWYPALVPDPAGPAVHGMVHAARATFCAQHLAAIDAYEDCRSDGSGEYRREPVVVATGAGECLAEAYIYNASLPAGARPVPGGDFRAFVAEHGLACFG
jgi:gamma-glutamylcyclotransferase (GGCT)/AIG2-like uncharacterized protein YtfP